MWPSRSVPVVREAEHEHVSQPLVAGRVAAVDQDAHGGAVCPKGEDADSQLRGIIRRRACYKLHTVPESMMYNETNP